MRKIKLQNCNVIVQIKYMNLIVVKITLNTLIEYTKSSSLSIRFNTDSHNLDVIRSTRSIVE